MIGFEYRFESKRRREFRPLFSGRATERKKRGGDWLNPLLRSFFPGLDCPFMWRKKRMRLNERSGFERRDEAGRAFFQFFKQMLPFKFELACRDRKRIRQNSLSVEFGRIETVTPACGFGEKTGQVDVDSRFRERCPAKPFQLGMMPVTFRFFKQHLFGE